MHDHRSHTAVSGDGTEIVGAVRGVGPPLVLVHGGAGNGEVSWRFLLPHLEERFTCYALSTRGRGRSGDHPDHSIGALIGDVVAFVESIGAPVGIFGHSSALALAAATRTDAITAVAVHEPAVGALAADSAPDLEPTIGRVIEAADEGRFTDAVRIFFEDTGVFNDDEVATLVRTDAHDRMAPNVPAWCAEMAEYGGAVDPAVLREVPVPVLLLQGTRSPRWFRDSVDHVAAQLPDVRVREVADGGHMAPVVVPAAVAEELVRFLVPHAAAADAAG